MEYIINFTARQLRDKDKQKEYYDKCGKKIIRVISGFRAFLNLIIIWLAWAYNLKIGYVFAVIVALIIAEGIFLGRPLSLLISGLTLLTFEIESRYNLIIREDEFLLSNTYDEFPVVRDKKEKKKKKYKRALKIFSIIETEKYMYFLLTGVSYFLYLDKDECKEEEYIFIKQQLKKKWGRMYFEYEDNIRFFLKILYISTIDPFLKK